MQAGKRIMLVHRSVFFPFRNDSSTINYNTQSVEAKTYYSSIAWQVWSDLVQNGLFGGLGWQCNLLHDFDIGEGPCVERHL